MRLYPWMVAIRALNKHPLLFWGLVVIVLWLVGEMEPVR